MPAGKPKSGEGWGGVLGAHFVKCLATGAPPAFGGEHAVHVVEVMEAVFASSQNGQMVKRKSSF